MLHFEDFPTGRTGTLPAKTVDRDEVLAFARQFDPQPMHLDDAAAARSLLGGIAASGWHSCAMLMRMICDGFLLQTASLGSPGLEEVRWLKPVLPGDVLSAAYEVKAARVSRSLPSKGVCRFFYTVRRQDGDVAMTWDCTHFLACRSGGAMFDPRRATGGPSRTPPVAMQDRQSTDITHGLFLEDYQPGDVAMLGSHTFTADAITAFARAYDPQAFHLDGAAAAASPFRGLCASGWHTAAQWMRLMVRHQASLIKAVQARGETPGRLGPSPGFRDMRFIQPVRSGDCIAYTTRVLATEPWPGRPKWGLLLMHNEGINQHGETVFAFQGRVLVERRTPLG